MPRLADAIFWTVPLGIAGVAAWMGYRSYRDRPWETPKDAIVREYPSCTAGRYRCSKGDVQVTTGEEVNDGGTCLHRSIGTCKRECVSESVTLAGVDDEVAKRQLCDMPKRPAALVSEDRSYLDQHVSEAGSCESDGYIPNEEGFIQCVSRTGVDPNTTGVVVSRVKCRFGVVPTLDPTPRLIKREEAMSIWCKRDPSADTDYGTATPDASMPLLLDGATDARALDAATDTRPDAARPDAARADGAYRD